MTAETHRGQPRRETPNRLIHETSPYLLQHAWNPVDWSPWCPESLERAARESKPIFLSIGYSACHWCHVMEHESFENLEIARFLNEHFVSIKVDREERPELDQIYMSAVQLMTHRGGWPMSVFLTPDRRPFFGGTYWPPIASRGMPGFLDILRGVREAWNNRREDVLNAAESLTESLQNTADQLNDPTLLTTDLLTHAGKVLSRRADRTYGGFGDAPKFPHSMDLRVLLREWKRSGNRDALEVVLVTLDRMAYGGIYDQLEGGFHRYSTDVRWLVPHFEKMLYDNALLVPVYLEAYQATRNEDYGRIVRETLTYIEREMESPEGGFFSTQDADSEGVEGKFFVWQESEILELLGDHRGRIFCRAYDVSHHGNWEEANILNRPEPLERVAEGLEISIEELATTLGECREVLRVAREKRIPPARDEKILTAWNGMMIGAAAFAGRVLDEPRWTKMAERGVCFLLEKLRRPEGGLWHGYKDGEARLNAYLDDYACLIDGLIEVFLTTGDPQWLEVGSDLTEEMVRRFHDSEGGGFYYTSHDHEEMIARQKDLQDNATPSGNSMAAWVLVRLGYLVGRGEWESLGRETLERMSQFASQYPTASGQMLIATDFQIGPVQEVVVLEGNSPEENQEVRRLLNSRFSPNQLVLIQGGSPPPSEGSGLVEPWFRGKSGRDGKVTAYFCERGSCGLPAVGLESIRKSLAGVTL